MRQAAELDTIICNFFESNRSNSYWYIYLSIHPEKWLTGSEYSPKKKPPAPNHAAIMKERIHDHFYTFSKFHRLSTSCLLCPCTSYIHIACTVCQKLTCPYSQSHRQPYISMNTRFPVLVFCLHHTLTSKYNKRLIAAQHGNLRFTFTTGW